jgi:cytochrome c oxidase cbb3-type subunit 2
MRAITKALGATTCAAAALAVMSDAAWAQTQPAAVDGKAIYQRECVMCHGVKGDGEGTGANIVNPHPRDFSLGVFKLRSTPNGEPPTDDDLLRTITNGIRPAAMPSFKELPESERHALVGVVKEFAGIKKAGTPIKVPPAPAASPELLTKGKQVYERLACATCHGTTGHADGPSSLTLKDDSKRKVWPADLTLGEFKGGSEPRDLYLRLATGLDGSPMPSYATKATSDEIWALVHYVRSLATDKTP